jgi:class 3 adenylate cyclase
LSEYSWPGAIKELRIRIGIHTGEAFSRNDNGRLTFGGPHVNRASRVQSAGHGGQTLISRATYDAVRDQNPATSVSVVAVFIV